MLPDVKLKVEKIEDVRLRFGEQSESSYNPLADKPKINGVILIGDKSSKDIHVQHEMDEVTPQDIDEIIFG